MKIILGIDPGLACTGYGVIQCEVSRYGYIAHGTIRTLSRDGIGVRLVQIHNSIKDVIKTYSPDEAGIESIYFARNSKSVIPVAQARGVMLFALAEEGIPFAEYTPLQLKQAVIGRGKAEKQQIQAVLKILLNLSDIPRPDHAADALAVAFCHANYSFAQSRLSYLRQRNV